MEEKKRITIYSLIKLRECSQKKRLSDLSLIGSPERERRKLISNTINTVKQHLLKGSCMDETMQAAVSLLKNGYCREWHALKQAYETALQKDTDRIRRLIAYLYEQNFTVIDIDIPYEIQIPGVRYRGESFDVICGKTDLIVKRGDTYEAICFQQGKPPYGYAARNEIAKAENAPELLLMKMGLEGRFHSVTCSLYFLKGKEDKASELLPFEYKRGKNIIQQDYSGYNLKGILSKFYAVMELKQKESCENCSVYKVCKFNCSFSHSDEKPAEEKTKEKEPHAGPPNYTDAQSAVIRHIDGPMNVIAVPGAGKTFSLVQRMFHMIEKGIPPQKILFVTFTNKACSEIRTRVIAALGTEDKKRLPKIYTFHALGYQILKDNPALVGWRVKLAGKIDRYGIIRTVLEELPAIQGVSYEGIYLKYGLIQRLEKEFAKIDEEGKSEWKTRSKWKDSDGVLRAYDRYYEIFREKGFVTYDMQISLCNELLEKHPGLAALYGKMFQYIMVDEFQDVSSDNAEMIYKIAKRHKNIVIVGDDDQSIYSFRGGSNQFLLHFPEEFEGAKTVIMNDNFRSNDKILSASEKLIKNNRERMDKNIIAHVTGQSSEPKFYKGFHDTDLIQAVETFIKQGRDPGDIAILGRFNKTLTNVAEILRPHLPVNPPKDFMIDDTVFGAVLDVLNIYFKGYDQDESAYRLLARLGQKNIKKENLSLPLLENIFLSEHILIPDSEKKRLDAYFEKLPDAGAAGAAKKIFLALKAVSHAEGIGHLFDSISRALFGTADCRITGSLMNLADERAFTKPDELYRFMQDMVYFQDETRISYGKTHAVHLLTAHDSKGKEFPVVIVHAVEEFGDTEEERRLLYVAMTRAKEELVLTEGIYQKAPLILECEA